MRQPLARRGLLIAGLGATLALLAGTARAQIGFEVQPWPAHKAPPLQAGIDANGKPLLLRDLRGQALVINFWATWCEPCREEMPSLALLAQSQSGKLRVLAVNFKESPTAVNQFAAATGLTIPTLRDPDGALARAWGIRVFPSTVLVGADGQVRSVVRGALDWHGETAARLIAPLLPSAAAPAVPKPGLLGQR
jgi:thiol-disulfide isomerase/thioredoxin